MATPAQLFQLSDQLVRSGRQQEAEAILALIAQNPSKDLRNEARFRLAQLLAAKGQITRAAVLLRRILDERPDAVPVRLELAKLLDRMGDKDGAWRQMRAIRSAGLPASVAKLVDRYSEALRSQRSSGANLEIAIAPDSNINRATRSETLGTVLGDFDISKESRAKSGVGASLHGQAYRRLPVSDTSSLLFRLSSFANLYRNSRFNDVVVDFAAGPELQVGKGRVQLEIGATQRWFGRKPFLRSARTAATLSKPMGSRSLLRLSGSASLVDNQQNDLEDGKVYSGQISLERALTPTLGLALTAGLDRQSLRDPAYSTTGWRVGMTGWRDLGRMTLTVGAELGRLRADERLLLFPRERSDRYSRISVGMIFRHVQFGGFAPLMRVSYERNHSSVEFYDYRRTRTEFGVVHAF